MNWETIVVVCLLVLILGGAVLYVYRAKKRGVKCIGCPSGGNCAGCAARCGCGQTDEALKQQ